MGSEWKIYSLGEIADIGSSKRIKAVDYVESGIPFYRSKEVIEKNKGNDISTELFITKDQFRSIESKFGAPKELDILLTSVGTLGVPYQVKKGEEFYFKDGNLTWFRGFKEFVNPRYIYFWLTSAIAKRKIDEVTIGSTQQALTIVALKSLLIDLPSIDTQNQIISHLEAISEKIQLNRQTNQTLEQMAQALFKSWFVDFDPVIDNALDAGNKIPEPLQQKAQQRAAIRAQQQAEAELANQSTLGDTAQKQSTASATDNNDTEQTSDLLSKGLPDHLRALFPSEFEETEALGWVPKGWGISTTLEMAKGIFSGGTPHTQTPEYWGGDYNWFSSGETRNKLIIDTEKSITKTGIENSSTKLSIKGDILIASAGQGHTRGQTSLNFMNTYINQSVVCIRPKTKALSLYLFQSLSFRYDEMRGISDSHSIRGSLTTKLIGGMKTIRPTEGLLNSFESIVEKYRDKQVAVIGEIGTLTKLRDTLLPKLISGELRLPDINTNSDQNQASA